MSSEPAWTIAPAPSWAVVVSSRMKTGNAPATANELPFAPAWTKDMSWTVVDAWIDNPTSPASTWAPPSMTAVATLVATSNRNDAPMPPLPPSAPNGSTRPRRAPFTDLFVLMLSPMFFQSVSPFLRMPARFRLSPPTPTTPIRCISIAEVTDTGWVPSRKRVSSDWLIAAPLRTRASAALVKRMIPIEPPALVLAWLAEVRMNVLNRFDEKPAVPSLT